MKLFVLCWPVAWLVTGCSPFSSGGDLLGSGRDGRVFNAATGRYEWAEAAPPRAKSKSPVVISARHAAPATPSDGRAFNAAKGRFESSDDEGITPDAPPR